MTTHSLLINIPQVSQSTSVWNDTVLVHPWIASIKDSSMEVCEKRDNWDALIKQFLSILKCVRIRKKKPWHPLQYSDGKSSWKNPDHNWKSCKIILDFRFEWIYIDKIDIICKRQIPGDIINMH